MKQMRAAAVVLLAIAAGACHRATPPPAPPPAAPFAFQQSTADASVSLSIPRAVRYRPELHLQLYNDGRRELAEFLTAAAADRPRAIAKGAPSPPYSRTLAWTVTARTGRLVGLRQDWSEYTGGAHPNHGALGLVWDKVLERPIDGRSLFSPKADYPRLDALLCAAVTAEKSRRLGGRPDAGWSCPGWRDSGFLLAPSSEPGRAGGLVFHFDPYVLGASADAGYDILIPQAQFHAALQPPYDREFAGDAGPPVIADPRGFILENTVLRQVAHAPEILIHVADEITPIWRQSEEALQRIGLEPPFWAFAWAGGQALARYLLDHPHEVRGRRVLDLATGSGLVAIAAMKAGASSVLAADIDPFCQAAVALNAAANGVEVAFTADNLLDRPPPPVEVILAGDICYEKPLAERVLAWLAEARAAGARVLIGDPRRSYFPEAALVRLADYQVPTTLELEDCAIKRAGVWTFPA